VPHIIRKEKKKISLRQYNLKGKVQGEISPVEALFYALPRGSFGNSLDRAVAEASLLGTISGKKAENLTKA